LDGEQLNSAYNYRSACEWRLPDAPGVSVFAKGPDGKVFHTYSCYSRGLDMLNNAFQYLDLVPKGRNEDGLEFSADDNVFCVITFSYIVPSEERVDALLAEAERAGG
jgi:predicted dithiol-disulfide oxidoreductase (DUF899 family)